MTADEIDFAILVEFDFKLFPELLIVVRKDTQSRRLDLQVSAIPTRLNDNLVVGGLNQSHLLPGLGVLIVATARSP